MEATMFAIVTHERDPFTLLDLPSGLESWVQIAGGYAMLGAVLWLLFGYLFMRPTERSRIPAWQRLQFSVCVLAALASYLVLLVLRLPDLKNFFAPPPGSFGATQAPPPPPLSPRERLMLTLGGGFALLAVLVPFLQGIFSFRVRRIFAIAKLSFKEAIRKRVLYVFSALLLVFLFGSWFITAKPEDQVRTYVQVVYFVMAFLLIVAVAFLAGFSIPTDIRQLTIHTIVTKPVEKFEIVLGRFLGYVALMSAVLLVMTTFCLLYVLRGVGPDAADESLKARVPHYGELAFENTESRRHGESVGREWEYRSYISAPSPGKEPQTAIWEMPPLPAGATARDKVRCEFAFDIYRTTKGEENKGISCFFTFHVGPFDRARENEYRERHRQPDPALDARLAEELGIYEVPSKAISDFHTQTLDVPAALFRHTPKESRGPDDRKVFVRVKCNSRTQYIGMARYDLYFRLDDPEARTDTAQFAWNFFKGSIGLWLRLCLVAGLAVTVSTYLSGPISLLLALLLFLGGLSREFIQTVAVGSNVGGGPTEALIRLVNREHISAPREASTTQKVAEYSDALLRWFIRRVLDIVPDVDRYDLTNYVAEGFNISGGQLALDALLLIGYLLPWFVLAFFIMKWREIATW